MVSEKQIAFACKIISQEEVDGRGVCPDPKTFENYVRTAARVFEAALSTDAEPVAVTVKPLEWKYDSFQSMWRANTVIGDYIAWCISGNAFFSFHPTANSPTKAGSSEDEAKTAGQADYERRILSALSHTTPPQPREGVE